MIVVAIANYLKSAADHYNDCYIIFMYTICILIATCMELAADYLCCPVGTNPTIKDWGRNIRPINIVG